MIALAPPKLRVLANVGTESLVHWAQVDPATGRILQICSPSIAKMPTELRASMNLQAISHKDAIGIHADPTDRTLVGSVVGRCAPMATRLASDARAYRGRMLQDTDYLMTSDSPAPAAAVTAWRVYRQALRDITKQAGWPANIVWPTPPSSS